MSRGIKFYRCNRCRKTYSVVLIDEKDSGDPRRCVYCYGMDTIKLKDRDEEDVNQQEVKP